MAEKWGFLRETKESADDAGIDSDTGLHRTGLEEYLTVIFPDADVNDWVNNKQIPSAVQLEKGCDKVRKFRPDYRNEKLNIIIEFDGTQHYTNPDKMLSDDMAVDFYRSLGYKIVRIPYFIQLTNDAVKKLFDVEVEEALFNNKYPSLGSGGRHTPAYLCYDGIIRMAKDFKNFPDQYVVNVTALKAITDSRLSRVELLEAEYKKLI
jgi:very-short-patch-repair endonuclease